VLDSQLILEDARVICERVELNELDGSTVLVTGASGLIGTYVLASLCHLRDRGARLKVYAQILSDPPPHTSELIRAGKFETVQLDLADFAAYQHLPKADVIVHSAGYAQPAIFMANAAKTIQINTSATIALLSRLTDNGRFLFLSSSEVYSGLKKESFSETDIGITTPYHPRAAYIEGKRCGEAICQAFRAQGVQATSARLGHIYGPGTRKHDKRALYSLIEKALCYGKIEMLDSGTAIRTYCYVTDAVELLWKILLKGSEPVYNVGGRSTTTIAQLATMIGDITGAPVIVPAVQGGIAGAPEDAPLDLTRIERDFGKTSYVSLGTGLKTTIDWQRELYR